VPETEGDALLEGDHVTDPEPERVTELLRVLESDPFEIDAVNDDDVDTECDTVSVLLAEFVKVLLLVDDIELDPIVSLNESLVEADCEWDLREAVRVPAAYTEGSGHHAMAHIIMTISSLRAAHEVDNDRCIVVWKNDWSTNSTNSLPLT
jgi:hypothetical protein